MFWSRRETIYAISRLIVYIFFIKKNSKQAINIFKLFVTTKKIALGMKSNKTFALKCIWSDFIFNDKF